MAITAALAATMLPAAAFADAPAVEVTQNVHHDVSPVMRDLKFTQPASRLLHVLPWRRTQLLGSAFTPAVDTAVQSAALRPFKPVAGLNLLGVGTGFVGPQGRFTDSAAPPDTNGAVGDTQVVEWVNSAYAVFDKATGAAVLGPVSGNALWKGFGGGCETHNDGDPVVLFDKAAHRWVFTQFSVSSTPYLQCVAVSKTSDATGSYNRYSFQQPNFNDYPKLGTWPDAYYMTFNIFSSTFLGARSCALDRAAMLTGAAAIQECFQLSSNFGALLPADVDGATAPPAGSPNYQISYTTNALQLWSFHADFATPAKAKLTGPVLIPVATFKPACGGSGTCVPQKGTTQQLDSLSDRLMYRLAYRNFASATPPHESLVVSQSVKPPAAIKAAAAVRWYELRSPGSSPTVFQQGTFAPDATSRWMGSAAMDKAGDMLIGYSASSSTLNPSVRVTGRMPHEALGTLEAEQVVFQGKGSQSGQGLSRWGDYTAMSVDPSDDCTFWYFNEYEPSTGAFNWATRVASFKFPRCK